MGGRGGCRAKLTAVLGDGLPTSPRVRTNSCTPARTSIRTHTDQIIVVHIASVFHSRLVDTSHYTLSLPG